MFVTAKRKSAPFVFGAALAFTGIVALCSIVNLTISNYSFVWVLLWGIVAWANKQWLQRKENTLPKRVAWAGAACFIFLQAKGYQLQIHNGSNIRSWIACAVVALTFAPALSLPVTAYLKMDRIGSSSWKPVRISYWLLGIVFLFSAWFLVFLAYYPGLFAYDVHYQLDQYLSNQVTSWHPPLHTYYLGWFYTLGEKLRSHNVGFALHVLSQMLVLAVVFAYIIYDLRQNGCNAIWCIALFAIFGFFPVHSLLAISCTKDILFSGFFVLSAYQIYRLWFAPELVRKLGFVIRLFLFMVLACLFRNNFCYGLFLFLPFAFVFAKPGTRLQTGLVIVMCCVCSFASYQVVKNAYRDSAVESREMLSIPCQQLTRVVAKMKEAQAEDEGLIEKVREFIPNPERYRDDVSDFVRIQLELEEPEQTRKLIKLWMEVGLKYPLTYVDAFLLNTRGIWWMDDTSHASVYGVGLETRQGYLLTDTKNGYDIVHTSYFPALEGLFERLFSANEYQHIPVFSLLFAPALYLWFTLLTAMRAIVQKQQAVLMLCLFLLCYACTLLLGPCVLVRYYYFLFIMAPVLFVLTFGRNDSQGNICQK